MLIPSLGYGAFVAFLCGAGAGLITGLIHTKAAIPSFVATLGDPGLWTGVAFVLSNATPITVSQANYHYLNWVIGTTFGIPNVVLIAMACPGGLLHPGRVYALRPLRQSHRRRRAGCDRLRRQDRQIQDPRVYALRSTGRDLRHPAVGTMAGGSRGWPTASR